MASDKGIVDIGKNYKHLFHYLPDEKEKEFSKLLNLSNLEELTQSLFATMNVFDREAQILAQKSGFAYDLEVAKKLMTYAEEKLSNHWWIYFKLQKG